MVRHRCLHVLAQPPTPTSIFAYGGNDSTNDPQSVAPNPTIMTDRAEISELADISQPTEHYHALDNTSDHEPDQQTTSPPAPSTIFPDDPTNVLPGGFRLSSLHGMSFPDSLAVLDLGL